MDVSGKYIYIYIDVVLVTAPYRDHFVLWSDFVRLANGEVNASAMHVAHT